MAVTTTVPEILGETREVVLVTIVVVLVVLVTGSSSNSRYRIRMFRSMATTAIVVRRRWFWAQFRMEMWFVTVVANLATTAAIVPTGAGAVRADVVVTMHHAHKRPTGTSAGQICSTMGC